MGYLHKYPLLKLQRSLLKIRENVLTGTEVLMTSSTQYTWNTKFLRNKATQRMWQHTWDLHRLYPEQYAFAGSVKVTHFTFTGFCGVLCYLIVFFHHCFVVVDVVVLADASVGHLKCFLFSFYFCSFSSYCFGLRDKQKVGERDLAYKKEFWKWDVEYLRNTEE